MLLSVVSREDAISAPGYNDAFTDFQQLHALSQWQRRRHVHLAAHGRQSMTWHLVSTLAAWHCDFCSVVLSIAVDGCRNIRPGGGANTQRSGYQATQPHVPPCCTVRHAMCASLSNFGPCVANPRIP